MITAQRARLEVATNKSYILGKINVEVLKACSMGFYSVEYNIVALEDYDIEGAMQELKELGYIVERRTGSLPNDSWDFLFISWQK